MFTRDCDIYCECARGCDVSACPAGNKRIGSESARRKTDRSIGTSLVKDNQTGNKNSCYVLSNLLMKIRI